MKKSIFILALITLISTSVNLESRHGHGGSRTGAFFGGLALGSLGTAAATSESRSYRRSLEDEVYDLRAENADLRDRIRRLEKKLRRGRGKRN